VEELSIARGLEYSDRGRLVGHIVTGVLWIEERARRMGAFPEGLLDQLKHLVLSHHGEHEWGSPVLPLTAEAITLHALDNLDAKLWAYDRAVRDSAENGSPWTEWTKIFGRRLYKPVLNGGRASAAIEGPAPIARPAPERGSEAPPMAAPR
jgi:3'-5' exoribonuclease